MARDLAVFPAKVKQWLALLDFRVQHFPDENGVVARRMRRTQLATHLEECVLEHASPAGRTPEMDAQPVLRFGAVHALCEIFGNGLLILLEDADAELLFLFEHGEDFRAVVHANQNQHGMERNGSEGISGHAVNLARLALDSDDGDAGGKMAEGFAEFDC